MSFFNKNIGYKKKDLENVRDMDLESVNISSIKLAYNITFWFLLIAAVACIVVGFIFAVISLNGYRDVPDASIFSLIYSLIIMIVGPLASFLSWIFVRLFFGMIYDIKMMRYKMLADSTNKIDYVDEV